MAHVGCIRVFAFSCCFSLILLLSIVQAWDSPSTLPRSLRDPFQPVVKPVATRQTVVDQPRTTSMAATAVTTATVPVVNLGRLFIVEARLNGSRTVRLVVDTGASYTVLFPEIITEMGLENDPDTDLSLWTAGGEVGAQIVTLNTVQVGDMAVVNLPVAVLRLPNPPEGIDGLLGLSFLNRFVVTLDPRGAQLKLKRLQ
jgi:clan AA aspartic protease (TIGR02281 family)